MEFATRAFRTRRQKSSRFTRRRRFSTFVERLEARNLLASFLVNSGADGFDLVPGDGLCDDGVGACTLRGAIQEANALPGLDTISLPAGTYNLTLAGTNEDFALTGDLDIIDNLTITGAGAGSTTIDAAGLDRVFHIPASGAVSAVTLDGLTIKGGLATDAGSPFSSLFASSGGGILNEIFGNSITLSNSIVTDNIVQGSTVLFSSDAQGGGIADVGGNWMISNSEIMNNHALAIAGPFGPGTGRGGGIYAEFTTTNLLIDTTIANNEAAGGIDDGLVGAGAGQGGGIFGNSGTWTMVGSTTVDGNQALGGLGIVSPGGAGEGGGIYSQGSFWNFTLSPGGVISRNVAIGGDGGFAGGAASGGGIYSAFDSWFDPFTFAPIVNSTISGNTVTGGNADPGFGSGGAALGGGIFTLGTITAEHMTIAENNAIGGAGAFPGIGEGGGIYNGGSGVDLKSSIVAYNTASSLNPDLSGTFTSSDYNLIGDVGTATGFGLPGDLVGTVATPVDPLLGPLQNNGGPTETHELLAGSPAIDAADPFSLVLSDQRGVGRPIDGDVDTIAVNDIGAYEAAAPAAGADIAIEKLTNGIDADTPTGPLIGVGGTANFTYVVTNPGGVPLSNVVVTDSQGVAVSFVGGDANTNNLLDPGETWTYTGSTIVTAGQYMNTGTVTADDPMMMPVMDTDDSHHFGVLLGIDIEKSTDGVDADTPTGSEILVGGTASFTYTVTNTGNVALENVAVSDSEGVVVTYQSGDTDADNELDVSETWIYTGSTTVTAGQYMNTGTAVADDATDTIPGQIMATDDSHHFGAAPQIAIEKLVSVDGGSTFADADSPTGPSLVSSGPAPEFKYEVTLGTGAGAVPLSNVVVTDSVLGAIAGPASGDDGDGILEAGETWVYLATGTWSAGQNTNTASADGDFTDSQANTAAAPTATDDANYFGAVPQIAIQKLVSVDGGSTFVDADSPAGPTLLDGFDAPEFKYEVTLGTGAGAVDLSNIVVSDSQLGALPGPAGGDDGDGILEAGETWVYLATGSWAAGQQTNTASADGDFSDDGGTTEAAPTANDEANYFGAVTGIDVEKLVSVDGGGTFVDADTDPGPTLFQSAAVDPQFRFVLTNTGNVGLSNVSLTDTDLGGLVPPTPGVAGGDLDNDGILDTTETWTVEVTGSFALGQQTNTGTAGGDFTDDGGNSQQPSNDDDANYFGALVRIDIEKLTNGVDADSNVDPLMPQIAPGDTVTFDYLVSNTGNVPLSNIVVEDNNGTPLVPGDDFNPPPLLSGGFNVGDTNMDNILDLTEVWEYQSVTTAQDLNVVIDFETDGFGSPLTAGTIIDNEYANLGLSIFGDEDPVTGMNRAMIFDSGATTVDLDLGTPNTDFGGIGVGAGGAAGALGENRVAQGNILIVSDDLNPLTPDAANRGTVTFDWGSQAVRINSIHLLDVESGDNSIDLFDSGGSLMTSITSLPNTGDNGFQIVTINEPFVSKMVINFGLTPGSLDKVGIAKVDYDRTFSNLATATGQFNPTAVATDPSHYRNPLEASVDVEKSTQGQDADSPTGPVLLTSTQADFEYVVTNTGQVPLEPSSFDRTMFVLDDNGTPGNTADDFHAAYMSGDLNNNGIMELNEQWTYSASLFPITAGQFTNVGSVEAVDATGQVAGTATDSDTSNHFGADPQIDIEKLVSVDGGATFADADSGTGPKLVSSGPAPEFRFEVSLGTGAGSVPLSNIVVSDPSLGGAIAGPASGDDGDGILEAGETWIYLASGTWAAGQNTNTATATGDFTDDDSNFRQVSDNDMANYFGAAPQIEIEKLVSVDGGSTFVDADLPTGPTLVSSGPAPEFKFEVTLGSGAGAVALDNVVVSDSVLGPIAGPASGDDGDGILEAGETWIYLATGTWAAGQQTNTASADGDFTDDGSTTEVAVTANDAANYFGANPQIQIEKRTLDGTTTAGTVALDFATNATDGANILVGENVTWIYHVTSVGNVDLSSVNVTDDQGVTVSLLTGDDGDNVLESGEVWYFTATGTAVAGPYNNEGEAIGSFTDAGGHIGTDTETDGSSYFGVDAQIHIEKSTEGLDADTPTGPILAVGDTASFSYVVTNPGNVALSNVVVIDDNGTPGAGDDFNPTFTGGDTNTNNQLDLGETWTYTASTTVTGGQYANLATASGDDVTGTATSPAMDADASHHYGVGDNPITCSPTQDYSALIVTAADTSPFPTGTWPDGYYQTFPTGAEDFTVTFDHSFIPAGQMLDPAWAGSATFSYSMLDGNTTSDAWHAVGDRVTEYHDFNPGDIPNRSGREFNVFGRGHFTYNGSDGSSGGVDHLWQVTYDFTTLVNGYLPAGTIVGFSDIDGISVANESVLLSAALDSGGSDPWLAYEDDAANPEPAHGLAAYNALGNTYLLDGPNASNDHIGYVTTDNLASVTISITQGHGGSSLGMKFIAPLVPTCVEGTVRNDTADDNTLDGDEPGIAGVLVALFTDPNSDGDPTDGTEIGSTVTATDGTYAFPNQPAGDYVIVEFDPAGAVSDDDSQGAPTDNLVGITIDGVLPSLDNDFLDDFPGDALHSISGSVFDDDVSNDNMFGPDDDPIGGVLLRLYRDTNASGTAEVGELLATTLTDIDGDYSFSGLPDGNYLVVESDPFGAVSENDTQGDPLDNLIALTLAGADSTGNDFLDDGTIPYTISGQVRDDVDMDGDLGDPDAGINGVTVSLYTDPNGDGNPGDGVLVDQVLTNSNGDYQFSVLSPGDYVVVETDLAGYLSTADSDGANDNQVRVNLPVGINSAGNDFLDTLVDAGIHIEKSTYWQDADTPTGPLFPVGATTYFIYVVTNEGNVPLANVAVTDDAGTPGMPGDDFSPIFWTGDNNSNNLLDVGEAWYYYQYHTVTAGQYGNIGTVTAEDSTGTIPGLVTDDDPSHHFGVVTGIDIEKSTNGQDADTPTGPLLAVGDTANFTYTVMNTGNVALANVVVTDDQGVAVTYQSGDSDSDNELDVNETWIYTASTVVTAGQYANIGSVTAADATGTIAGTVSDDDTSHHFGVLAAIDIEKATEGQDADAPTGPYLPIGATANFTYVVTNAGNVALANVVVIDDQGVTVTYQSGDSDFDNQLDVNETWTYTGSTTVTAGQYVNIGTATAEDSTGTIPGMVSDNDMSHHFGTAPDIDIDKRVKDPDTGQFTDTTITFQDGVSVTFGYFVTNPGLLPLDNVTVVDDNATPGNTSDDVAFTIGSPEFVGGDLNNDGLLDLGETWQFEFTRVAEFIDGGNGTLGAVSELNKYLLIGTTSDSAAQAVDVQNGDLGADIIVLSTSINDNVDFDNDDVFLSNAGSRWVDVDNDYNTDPDYLPGAAQVGESVSWTGDVALTSPSGYFTFSNVELYGQVGLVADANNPVNSVSNSKFFPDGVGDGFNTGSGQNMPSNGVTANANAEMAALRSQLDTFEDFVTNLTPEVTLSPGNGLPTSEGIEDIGYFEMNVDPFDTDGDGIAVIDILVGGGDDDFQLTNSNWVIESDNGTFAIFRILGDSNLVLNQASILIGDGILGNDNATTPSAPVTELGAIFVKAQEFKNDQGQFNDGESLDSGDSVFSFNDTVLNGVGFYDLVAFGDSNNDPFFDNGTTEIAISNGQGCAHFISAALNFNNVRFDRCLLPVVADEEQTNTADASGSASGVIASDSDTQTIVVVGGAAARIHIEKTTEGEDADMPTGPLLAVGDTANFAYVVTNTGNVALANVVVTDDQGVTVTYQSGDSDSDNELDVNETWIYTGTTVVTAGQYTNIGSVTAEDATGTIAGSVTDDDPSHHFGVVPDVEIEKYVVRTETEEFTIDFDTDAAGNPLAAGTTVDDEYDDWGVNIVATNAAQPAAGNRAMVQDASTRGGGAGKVRFRNGSGSYVGTADTFTDEFEPNTNKGSQNYVAIDLFDGGTDATTQGLIRFDDIFGSGPGQIPYGSNILSASLTVNVNNPSDPAATITLHPMLVNWTESSTWNSLSGGVSTDDVEASSTADAVVASPGTTGFITVTGLESRLQAWLDAPSTNNGWVIVSDNDNGWDFRSSETYYVSQRPTLNVMYEESPIYDEEGNVLIISADGNPSNPIEEPTGGTIDVSFTTPVRVDQIGLLDIQTPGTSVTLFTTTGSQTIGISAAGVGSLQEILIDVEDVTSMEIELTGPGALTEIAFTQTDTINDPADSPPGPEFLVGDMIDFTYEVTNPGNIELSPVDIVDDNATPGNPGDDFNPTHVSGDTDMDGRLDPGETWIYAATITATTDGQFTNIGSATGTPVDAAGNPVGGPTSADDPGNYTVLPPAEIDIEKLVRIDAAPATTGEDLCDTYNDPAELTFQYTGGDETATNTAQDPGKYSVTDVVSGGPNFAASVFIRSSDDSDASKTDTLFFEGVVGLGLEFTIAGNFSSNTYIHIFDETASTLLQTVGYHTSCSAPIILGDVVGGVTVTGYYSETGEVIELPDPAPGVDQDADTPTGPAGEIGDQATLTFVVTNPGLVAFSNVVVTDDNETPGNPGDDFNPDPVLNGSFNLGDTDMDSLLDPGEEWLYTATKTVTLGQHVNTADVAGTPVDGQSDKSDSDPANWLGVSSFAPEIDIEKSTNGSDADEPTGPIVTVGDTVNFSYTVTNTGNVPLNNVTVTDDNGTPEDSGDDFSPSFTGGDNGNGVLDPGEVWTYSATATASAGQYANAATVDGTDDRGTNVADTDFSHHFGVNPSPSIDIEKLVRVQVSQSTGGDLCDAYANPTALTFQYTGGDDSATNTSQDPGKYSVTDVVSGGPNYASSVFIRSNDSTDANNTGTLFFEGIVDLNTEFTVAGNFGSHTYIHLFDLSGTTLLQTVDYHTSCSAPIVLGDVVGGVTLTGYLSDEGDLIELPETDPNGEDADTPTGPVGVVGDTFVFTYVVTNTGNAPLTNIQVTDSNLGTITNIIEQGNGDGILDSAETWILTATLATTFADAGQQMNLGTVTTAEGPGDSDPAYYFVEGVKFFVPDTDDDATYQYASGGQDLGSFDLQNDNTDARGAAALSDGSKLWVLDKEKDKNVYIYDGDGNVIGSWTARMTSAENHEMNDKVQGIATDDTSIWIVEQDKHNVYFYSGGASFVSGSHNATSKFSLHEDNDHAYGITTDGVNTWVVDDDGSNNRVFKYTVGGTYLGSWAIDSANDKPRGITIDPTGGSSIWIVDQDADQIFQYDGATGRTSGSQSADFVYNLDPDNDKAEGIADPPPRRTNSFELQTSPIDAPAASVLPKIDALRSNDIFSGFARIEPQASLWDVARPRLANDPFVAGRSAFTRRDEFRSVPAGMQPRVHAAEAADAFDFAEEDDLLEGGRPESVDTLFGQFGAADAADLLATLLDVD